MRLGRVDRGFGAEIAYEIDGKVAVVEDRLGGSMRRLIESSIDPTTLPVVAELGAHEVRLLAPIDDPGKIVAIGLNYLDHAAEVGVEAPHEPLVFAKFPSSIVGPGAPIGWPASLTAAVDAEAELAVVIGTRTGGQGPIPIFGYTCLNDVSARDLQARDGQWVRAKSLPSFAPIGPWLVTNDSIPDPMALKISCEVSGEVLQTARTSDMIFGIHVLVERLDRELSLRPGDVIATGTPPGIGWTRTPQRLLRAGDVVTVEIDGIGRLTNPVAGPLA